MPNVTFLDTPGRLYDLYFLFILNFNKDIYLSDNASVKLTPEEVAYYTNLLESFPPISDDLRIFFQIGSAKKCFMKRFYFDQILHSLISGQYNLSTVRLDLSDVSRVTDNILLHFFPDLDTQSPVQPDSLTSINKIIKASSHPDEIKNALYDFFIDPNALIRQLSDELLEKSFFQEQDCNRNHKIYQDLRNSFNYSSVSEDLIRLKAKTIDLSSFDCINVSFCLYAKSIVYSGFSGNSSVLLLGSDYLKIISDLRTNSMLPDLKVFGQAISDTNRVSILDLIDKRGKISAKDVEQELELSAPNAYYHLSLMIKSGLLSATNVGKSVFYSINSEYIRSLKRRLDCYLDKKERM